VQKPGQGGSSGEFRNLLENAIGQVDGLRSTANATVERFLSGENEELHSTVMATQRAELAFEMFMQVRNKVVQAYQEVMRMQM
jgi:flagellar hook-basal body complex protein FliE